MAVIKIKTIKSNLQAVINYGKNGDKTDNGILVSSVNCSVDTAYEEMSLTKKFFHKDDKTLGYHIIQSFNVYVKKNRSTQYYKILHIPIETKIPIISPAKAANRINFKNITGENSGITATENRSGSTERKFARKWAVIDATTQGTKAE